MPEASRLNFADIAHTDEPGWRAFRILTEAQADLSRINEGHPAVAMAMLAVYGAMTGVAKILLPRITEDMFPDRDDLEDASRTGGGQGAEDVL